MSSVVESSRGRSRMRYDNTQVPDDSKNSRSRQNRVTQQDEYQVNEPNDNLEPPVFGARGSAAEFRVVAQAAPKPTNGSGHVGRLPVKLRGRPEAPNQAPRAHSLCCTRGAKPHTVHGPLQRLLGALSHSYEVWKSNEQQAQYDEQDGV